jgi:hypothetical protein
VWGSSGHCDDLRVDAEVRRPGGIRRRFLLGKNNRTVSVGFWLPVIGTCGAASEFADVP